MTRNFFVTGASGFIGLEITKQLLAKGYQVTGLVRSDAGEKRVRDVGATPVRGDINDIPSLVALAAKSDGVFHFAFNHDDWSTYIQTCQHDAKIIEAIGQTLKGTQRPFVVASALSMLCVKGEKRSAYITENENVISQAPRGLTEVAINKLRAEDVNVTALRLPIVHGPNDHGFLYMLLQQAKKIGYVGYPDDGSNRWAFADVSDVAKVATLAIETENAPLRATYHAVSDADDGVTFLQIAEALAKKSNLETKSIDSKNIEALQQAFGFLAFIVGDDFPASNQITKDSLNVKAFDGRYVLNDIEDFYNF